MLDTNGAYLHPYITTNKQQQLRPVAESQEVQRHFLPALKLVILSSAIILPRPASFLYLTIHDTYEECFAEI